MSDPPAPSRPGTSSSSPIGSGATLVPVALHPIDRRDGFENEQDWFDFSNCFFSPPDACE